MMVATLLAACVAMRPTMLTVVVSISAMLLATFGDIDYFVGRAVLSADSDNTSVLVLLQGWETARMSIERTHGWGAGFQQFGVTNFGGEIADMGSVQQGAGIHPPVFMV